jgi:3-hydroxy acid dehydrogenase / malonic semialdehyde reductase
VLRMTRLFLPHVRDGGHILFMGSVAGRSAYPNGASYIASKFAVRGFVYALREDLLGRPIRVTTVDAGLVETEFSLVRFKGNADEARAVYDGIDPITPDEVADCVLFALTRPPHVNVDEIVIKALQQAGGARVARRDPPA